MSRVERSGCHSLNFCSREMLMNANAPLNYEIALFMDNTCWLATVHSNRNSRSERLLVVDNETE